MIISGIGENERRTVSLIGRKAQQLWGVYKKTAGNVLLFYWTIVLEMGGLIS